MNIFTKNTIFSTLTLSVMLIVSSIAFAKNSDCDDCCTGAQITTPVIAPDTQFTNPSCSDQLDAATFLLLVSGALENGSILRLLQQEIYNRTNPIVVRSLLDLPSLRPYFLDYCGWQVVVQPFYSQMDPVYVTKHSPFIKSYINLGVPALANEIDLILEDINNAGVLETPINIDIPQTLSLFQNLRAQEYRAGFMFSFAKEYKDWNFSFRIPVYYMIHNFFLNNTEIDNIKNAPLFTDDGLWGQGGTTGTVNEFVFTNLVNDKVGFGDSRFMALYNLASSYKNDIWLGAIATLPTAVKVKEGMIGGSFNKCESIPAFDLLSIANLSLCGRGYKVTEMLETIGIAALRKLSILLVDIPLGNGGHFGVGPHFDIRHFYNDVLSTRTMIEAEFFSSKTKKRFFLEDKSRFNFNLDLTDGDMANQNIAFLNEQVLNTFFPVCSKVDVTPGWLFKAYHELMLDFNCWQLVGGFDFWYQGAEKIGANFCGSMVSFDTLSKGRRLSAYQGKIFGSFSHYRHSSDFDWSLALTYDDTVFNKGIGKDFTVGLAFTMYL